MEFNATARGAGRKIRTSTSPGVGQQLAVEVRESIRERIAPFVNAGGGDRVHVNVVSDKELV